MATKTRTPKDVEAAQVARADKVEALNDELVMAVEALADSGAWRRMLEVSARFTRYSINNQLLLWAQAEQRGVTLTRVAAFGTWKKLATGSRPDRRALGFTSRCAIVCGLTKCRRGSRRAATRTTPRAARGWSFGHS